MEERSERLRKLKERDHAKHTTKTASERQVTLQRKSTHEHERMANETSEEREMRLQRARCKRGYSRWETNWQLKPWGEGKFTADEHQPAWKVGSWNPQERKLRLECYRTTVCSHNYYCFKSVPFKAKMSCKHGYIVHANMLNLFRNISWLSFTQSLMYFCVVAVTSMLQNDAPLPTMWFIQETKL